MKEAMRSPLCRVAVALALLVANAPAWSQTEEARSLEEVRNTVINLLEALVQKGVMTAEQAQAMVVAAQEKATTDAKARAERDAADSDAVRVTYVPEIVRKQISEQVRADLKQEVTQEVMAQAKADGWGVPAALPEWIKGVRLYGDVRARTQGDMFASDNSANTYLDVNAVNDSGGIGAAGFDAILNTTQDRNRVVGRVRAGLTAQLGNAFGVDVRLASGNQRSPVSTNQTLGSYGGRWELNVDKAAVLWNPINADRDREFDLRVGRFANPFVSYNELIWDNDLTFEGLSATYALDLFGNSPGRMERGLFLTLGAFPLQEVELSSDDKWLYGGQLGAELPFGRSRLRFSGGYFSYDNITGTRNTLDSNVFDFTAPRFVQRGNTLFDIRVSSDPGQSQNLLALAGEYELASANVVLDLAFGETHVVIGGEYVKNLAWEADDVLSRTNGAVYILEESGTPLRDRTAGYEAGVMVGRPTLTELWHWRASMSYRYVERDAVLDAFTDSDFHLGGTDAKGYQLGLDLGLSRGAWLRLRYLSANEIDGPPLGIDVWQLDLNGTF